MIPQLCSQQLTWQTNKPDTASALAQSYRCMDIHLHHSYAFKISVHISTQWQIQNCDLLGYYAASSGNFSPTFRDSLSVSSSCPLKMGPISCAETSVRNYHYSLRNSPEERRKLKITIWQLGLSQWGGNIIWRSSRIGLRRTRCRESGEDYKTRSFMICTPHQSLGSSNNEAWDGWGMWHVWREGEAQTFFLGGETWRKETTWTT